MIPRDLEYFDENESGERTLVKCFRNVGRKPVASPAQIRENGLGKLSLSPGFCFPLIDLPLSNLQGIGVAAFSLAIPGIPSTGQREVPGKCFSDFIGFLRRVKGIRDRPEPRQDAHLSTKETERGPRGS